MAGPVFLPMAARVVAQTVAAAQPVAERKYQEGPVLILGLPFKEVTPTAATTQPAQLMTVAVVEVASLAVAPPAGMA